MAPGAHGVRSGTPQIHPWGPGAHGGVFGCVGATDLWLARSKQPLARSKQATMSGEGTDGGTVFALHHPWGPWGAPQNSQKSTRGAQGPRGDPWAALGCPGIQKSQIKKIKT